MLKSEFKSNYKQNNDRYHNKFWHLNYVHTLKFINNLSLHKSLLKKINKRIQNMATTSNSW